MPVIGHYLPGAEPPRPGRAAVLDALQRLDRPFSVVSTPQGPAAATGGRAVLGEPPSGGALALLAHVPALAPDALGDPDFRAAHGLRVAYVAGAMANGIASVALVSAMARAGMLGFFGAAGLSTERIRAALSSLSSDLGDLPWGVNLIHSPAEPHQEQATVDLLLAHGVRAVEASAFLGLTPMVVELRARGLRALPDGRIERQVRLMAKVSRPEVAERFLRPPPDDLLRGLVQRGRITTEQARLAARVPMADDLTAEADSGGHTDNRPLPVLLPLLQGVRDRIGAELGHEAPVRIGAAGGIGCPSAAAAAFAMGAAYVLTGTVNQACVESGTSAMAREMLAEADMADVGMAPASDMFEGGVQVQVLKRGTLFPMRGRHLYELYRDHASLDAIPAEVRRKIEAQILRQPVAAVWSECQAFFRERDPAQLERAARDPKHQMALVFRWYLGRSSRWAIAGEADRRTDAQIWCGPAIGSFNAWTRDTFLARPENRGVVTVAANLMSGAAYLTRARWLREQGVDLGVEGSVWRPRPLASPPTPPAERASHVPV